MKQRISKLLTIATTALTLALASCVVDVKNPVVFGPGEGESVTISFNPHIDGVNPPATRATRAFPDQGQLDPGGGEQGSDAVGKEPEDVEIVDLRVLLYKSSTGQFVDEDQATVDAPGEPVELELVTGVYDVVLIANASSDTGLAPAGRLNAVFGTVGNYNNLNKVKNALLDSRAFEEDDTPIPMFALVRNVHIMLDGSVEIDGAEAQNTHINPWAPILKRVGVRISMEIELTPYQYIDWNAAGRKIEISKIPDRAWLWDSGKSNGDPDQREADARVYTASPADAPATGYDGYTEYVAPEPAQGTDPAVEEHYLVRFDRIIVPELVFDDTDDAELAAVLSMDMDNDLVVSGRISGPNPDSSADGFTLPRNLWLHLDVSIAGSRLEVIPKVIPWNNEAAGGPFLDKDWLRARGPVYIAGVWPQTFDAVTSLDAVTLLMENGNPKIEYLQGDGWLIVEPAATTTPGNENGVDTQTRTITVKANADNTGKYRRAKVWVVATDETTGKKIEKWVEVIHTSGVPVPAGVIGYVAEGPEFGRLTLRGSREYATPVYDGRPVFSDAALEMFPDQGGLESVTVYAAYFKWGSLVATSSELTDNVFDADDIVAAPEDFNNIGYPVPALEAVRNVVQNIWARVPVRSGSDALANSWKSEPVEGLGDPCAYYFKDWRMPVGGAEDRSTEADGWNNGTFGTARAGVGGQPVAARGVSFAAGDLGPGVPAGRRAGNGTSAYPADWSMFLPYAGGRSGGVQGSNGIYWSSTPSTDTHGYHLGVQPDTAYPAHEQVYTNAYTVRCIDTDPPLPRGVHAAPGTIGYIAQGPDRGKLTLRGSSAYAGTEVDNATNTAAFGPLEDYAVYQSLFKFGSAIALSSQLSDTFDSGDIIAAPDGYDLDGLKARVAATATPNDAWSEVPHNTAAASTADGWPQRLSDGLGNPCVTYFGNGWTMPTAGDSEPRGWYKEGGAPFLTSAGSSINWADFTATGGRWVNPVSNPLYSRFPEQGIVAGDGSGGQDWHMFLSTGGVRNHDTGTSDKQRTNLQYWTITTTDATNGYYLTAGDESMNPRYNWHRSHGMSVRCVVAPDIATYLTVDPEVIVFEHDRSVITPAATAGQSVTVEVSSDGDWTVALSGTDAARFTLSTTRGNGNGSFTVTPTGDNSGSYATQMWNATVTVTATGTSPLLKKTVIVTQRPEQRIWGGENHLLYFDNGTIRIGRWDTAGLTPTAEYIDDRVENVEIISNRAILALFKHGSVIGFDLAGTVSGAMTAIRFNPTTLTVGTGGDITTYGKDEDAVPPAIPWTSGSYRGNVSSPEYHNADNILAGKGDPCKLAGIEMGYFNNLNDEDKRGFIATYDNGGWRLPTDDENQMFVGNIPIDDATVRNVNESYDGRVYYRTSSPYAGAWSSTNPGTGIFEANPQVPGVTLPAVGLRTFNFGSAQSQGQSAYFWSSDTTMDYSGFALSMTSTLVRDRTDVYGPNGNLVRCVNDKYNPYGPNYIGPR